jgi:hypothetical protein
MARQALDSALLEAGVKHVDQAEASELTCVLDDQTVTIGKTSISRHQTQTKSKVPDVLFYDVPQVLIWIPLVGKEILNLLLFAALGSFGMAHARFCSWRASVVGRKPGCGKEQAHRPTFVPA